MKAGFSIFVAVLCFGLTAAVNSKWNYLLHGFKKGLFKLVCTKKIFWRSGREQLIRLVAKHFLSNLWFLLGTYLVCISYE